MKKLLPFLLTVPALGQAVHLTGGQSSLMNSEGAGALFYLPNNEVYIGGGRGFSISDKTSFDRLDFTLGDGMFSYSVDGAGTTIWNRGIKVEKTEQDTTIGAFAGLTGLSYQVPFFASMYGAKYPGAGIYYRRKLNKWKVSSLDLFSRQKTVIQSVAYDGLKLKFFANGGIVNNLWQTGATFIFRPDQHLSLFGTHVNQPNYTNDNVSGNVSAGPFQVNGSYVRGSFNGKEMTGTNVGGQVRWNVLTVRSDFYSSSGHQQVLNTLIEQTLHWSLTQSISTANQYQFGAAFHNNRYALSFNHGIAFVPGLGYKQILTVGINFHFHDSGLNASVFKLFNGWKYTAYGDQWMQGPLAVDSKHSLHHHSIGKYVQTGKVLRADASGVEGIAVRVGNEIVYTDRTGTWVYRSRKKTSLPVTVVLDESIAPGDWQIVEESADKTVIANK